MEIYAPIADRLGISKIKIELDDLSLKFLQPDVDVYKRQAWGFTPTRLRS